MMKRVLLLLLLCLPVLALADEMPAHVRTLLEEYHGGLQSVEYIGFEMADGRQYGYAITDGSSLEGFACEEEGWHFELMTSVMGEMRPAHLERAADEEAAFAIVSEDGRSRLVYRFDGECFRLAAWRFPDCPMVTADGERLIYDMGDRLVEVTLPGGLPTDWPWNMDDLPLLPEHAEELAAITGQRVADLYPGYTLRHYSSYNTGTSADAAYSRVKDGLLFIRRVAFDSAHDYEPQVTDCVTVPLSEALQARLETEPFDSLICCMSGSDTFLTQDAFDRVSLALPADAVILDNQVQEHSVIALVEEDGARYLYIWEMAEDAGANGDGFAARRTQPLPEGASLDLFHVVDGEVQLEWALQQYQATFRRAADGQWLLQWFDDFDAGEYLGACAFGVWAQSSDGWQRLRVGTLAGRDLFSASLGTLDAAEPQLDRTGWAVVNNPDPADRLHLRVSADKSSRSQGKFYNGTPVRVLGARGEWTQVQMGLGSTAHTGWMMTKYLAFGEDMDAVEDAWPDLFFREEYERNSQLDGGYRVVGVESDEQYILLGMDGEVMYVPQSWLWGGNG